MLYALVRASSDNIKVDKINLNFILFFIIGCIIDTDFHHYLGPDRDAEEFIAASEVCAQRHPVQRNGLTEDCVNAISFLTKESASFLTGILLRVDGGLSTKSVV